VTLDMRVLNSITACAALLTAFVLWTDAQADDALWSASPSIHLLLGGQNTLGGGTAALNQHTSAWEGIYEQPNLVGNLSLQIRYLNEGYLGPTQVPWSVPLHQPLHYRDAYGLQLSYWTPVFSNCRAAAALGPEIYFDTFTSTFRAEYEDRHGVGIQPSIAAQCHISERWAIELIASRSFDVASFNATTVLLGFTYTPRYAYQSHEGEHSDTHLTQRYVELTAGRSEVDCFHVTDETGSAIWATYGQKLNDPLAFEVSLLNEDVAGILQRRGLSAQLLAEHGFANDRIQVFVGLGPELTRSHDDIAQTLNTKVNLLLSYGVRVPVGHHAAFVLRFGRVESASGRNDTDLLSAGLAINLSSG
jgi:hypothetical protein